MPDDDLKRFAADAAASPEPEALPESLRPNLQQWLLGGEAANTAAFSAATDWARQQDAARWDRVRRVVRQTGLPYGVVEAHLEDAELAARKTDFDAPAFAAAHPQLAAWALKSPANAVTTAAHGQDMGTLGWLLGDLSGARGALGRYPLFIRALLPGWSAEYERRTLPTDALGAPIRALVQGWAQTQIAEIGRAALTQRRALTPEEWTQVQDLEQYSARPVAGDPELIADIQHLFSGPGGTLPESADLLKRGVEHPIDAGLALLSEGTKQAANTLYGASWGAKYALAAAGGTAAAEASTGAGVVAVPFTVPEAAGIGWMAGNSEGTRRMESGLAYIQNLRETQQRGFAPDIAAAANSAEATGLVNGLLEVIPFLGWVRKFPGLRGLFKAGEKVTVGAALKKLTAAGVAKAIVKEGAKELASESLTEGLQQGVSSLAQEGTVLASGGKLGVDTQFSAIPAAMAQDATMAALTMPVVMAPGTFSEVREKVGRLRDAQRFTKFVGAVADAAAQSKLRETAPEVYAEAADAAAKGGAAETVRTDVKAWDEHWLGQGANPREVAVELLGEDGGKQYDEAKENGGELVLPIGVWASRIAPTEHGVALFQDSRLGTGQTTPREARWFEQRRAALQSRIEADLAADAEAWRAYLPDDETRGIVDGFVESAVQAGITPADARRYAAPVVAFLRTQLDRANDSLPEGERLTGRDLYAGYRIVVDAEGRPSFVDARPEAPPASPAPGLNARWETSAPAARLALTRRDELGVEPSDADRAAIAEQERVLEAVRALPPQLVRDLSPELQREWQRFHARERYGVNELDALDRVVSASLAAGDVEGARAELRRLADPTDGLSDEQLAARTPEEVAGHDAASVAVAAARQRLEERIGGAAGPRVAPGGARSFGYSVTDPSRTYQLEYRVVPLASLQTSHDIAGRPNPDYPMAELQERDRGASASREQVAEIARRPGSLDITLAELLSIDRGAPIVGADDLAVESGNGRVAAMRLAAEEGTAAWRSYQAALPARAAELGLSTAGVENPVLVRVRAGADAAMSPEERVAFTRDANGSSTLQKSATELARTDAERITPELLSELPATEDNSLDDLLVTADGAAWIRDYLHRVPVNDHGRFLAQDGKIGKKGIEAIRWALLRRIFSGVYADRLLRSLTETPGEGKVHLEKAIFYALPRLARLAGALERGEIDAAYDVRPGIVAALDVYARAKRAGQDPRGMAEQAGLFGDELDDAGRTIVASIDAAINSSARLGGYFNGYANAVLNLPPASQGALFGDAPPTPAEIWRLNAEAVDAAESARSAARKAKSGGQAELVEAQSAIPAEAEPSFEESARIAFQSEPREAPASGEPPRLMAVHNLTADKLLFADRMGGLAVPSVGVVTDRSGGVERFGEITLIGTQDLADPSSEPVFGSDAYSSRYPAPEWRRAKNGDVRALVNEIRATAGEFEERGLVEETVERMTAAPDAAKVVEAWLRSSAVKALFLREHGVDVEPVLRDVPLRTPIPRERLAELKSLYDAIDRSLGAEVLDSTAWRALAAEYARIVTETFRQVGRRAELAAQLSAFNLRTFDALGADLSNAARREVDERKTSEELDRRLDQHAAEFKAWVEAKVLPRFAAPFLTLSGKRLPYTLPNIVRLMTAGSAVRGKERTLTFGAGRARAASSVRFADIEQMRQAAARAVVDPEEYERAKADTERQLEAYRTAVVPFTTRRDGWGRPDTWAALDASMRAIAAFSTGRRQDAAALRKALRSEGFDAEAIPDDVIEGGVKAGKALLSAPVPYFEAKPQRSVALDEFAGAVIPHDAPEAVRAALAKHGLAVAEYRESAERGGVVRRLASSLSAQGLTTLFQGAGPERGYLTFTKDEGPRVFTVRLLAGADRSTVLHELGHTFFEMTHDLATRAGAPESLARDWAAIEAWTGRSWAELLRDRERAAAIVADARRRNPEAKTVWEALSAAEREEISRINEPIERFARAFESYLMEGKSPSAEMAGVFARFRAWLLAVYRSARALDVELTDDVRGVFDRLLATDDEIRRAEEAQGYELLPNAAAYGMTTAEYEALRAADAEAHDYAVREAERRALSDATAEARAARRQLERPIRDEVEAEVDADPAQRAAYALARGTAPDGTPLVEARLHVKLGTASLDPLLAKILGADRVAEGRRKLAFMWHGKGIDVELAAELLGYDSGERLVRALLERRGRRDMIDAEVARRYAERHGDPTADEQRARESALDAVHGTRRGDVLMEELRALSRRNGERPPARQLIRDYARRRIAETRVLDLDPGAFERAARSAARRFAEAAASGDVPAAVKAKRQQLLNWYLYREARAARGRSDQIADHLSRLDSSRRTRAVIGRAGGQFLAQLDALLGRFHFGSAPFRDVRALADLRTWVQRQAEGGIDIAVPDWMLADTRKLHWRELTVGELDDLDAACSSIEHAARTVTSLVVAGERQAFDAVVGEAVKALEHRNPGAGPLVLDKRADRSLRKRLGHVARSLDLSHAPLEEIALQLDGGNEDGVFTRLLTHALADCERQEQEILKAASETIVAAVQNMTHAERTRMRTETHFIASIGQTLSHQACLAVALNWGCSSNRRKTLIGYQTTNGGLTAWSMETVEEILGHLTRADWELVQSVWDSFEATLWPKIEAQQRRTIGYAPPHFVGQPFTQLLADGTLMELRGGYYPIVYHPDLSNRGRINETQDVAALYDAGHTPWITPHGHTVERIEDYARPLLLDLFVIPQHVAKVAHDLAYREALVAAHRVLTDDRVQTEMIRRMGAEYHRMIIDRLNRVANSRVYEDGLRAAVVGKVLEHYRSAMLVGAMGFKIALLLQNFAANLGPSLSAVGPKWYAEGAVEINRRGAEGREWIRQVSPEMRDRMAQRDANVAHEIEMGWAANGAIRDVHHAALAFQGYGDLPHAYATWMGGYLRAQAEGRTEAQAIRRADRAVRLALGTGQKWAVAAVQDSPGLRYIYMFNSWFVNAVYRQQRAAVLELAGNVREGHPLKALSVFAYRELLTLVFPAVLGALAMGHYPGRDRKDESWLSWAGKEIALYLTGIPVLLRDVARQILGGHGVSVSPIESILMQDAKTLAGPARSAFGKQPWNKTFGIAAEDLAWHLGLPVSQGKATGGYAYDWATGKVHPRGAGDVATGLAFPRTAERKREGR